MRGKRAQGKDETAKPGRRSRIPLRSMRATPERGQVTFFGTVGWVLTQRFGRRGVH
jgi:hypothetical protein